jgi:hypothetical protein
MDEIARSKGGKAMRKATAQQKNDTAKFPTNETAEPSDLAGDLALSDAAAEQVTAGTSAGGVIDGIGKALSDASRQGGG